MQIIAWSPEKIVELVKLWNKELAEDFPMSEALFKQNSFDDVNVLYESSYIALNDQDQVTGFIAAKRWQEKIDVKMNPKKGWIQTLLVDSAHRGKGTGSALLARVESDFRVNGIDEIQLGGDPFHYFPGIPDPYKETQQWAEKHGYRKKLNTYDLINHLSKEYAFPDDNTVEFSLLQKDEKEEFISFFERCFPGRWEYEAIKYFEMNGDGREFVVLRKKERIIGFCRINDAQSPFISQNVYWSPLFEQEIGGIGPLGIDENEQKKGYGLAIVQAAVVYLQKRKIKTIIIDWTDLVEFYGRLDFETWKKYGIYLKKLT